MTKPDANHDHNEYYSHLEQDLTNPTIPRSVHFVISGEWVRAFGAGHVELLRAVLRVEARGGKQLLKMTNKFDPFWRNVTLT